MKNVALFLMSVLAGCMSLLVISYSQRAEITDAEREMIREEGKLIGICIAHRMRIGLETSDCFER